MTLQVNTICVNTAYGVAISVNGIAQVWELQPARDLPADREYLNILFIYPQSESETIFHEWIQWFSLIPTQALCRHVLRKNLLDLTNHQPINLAEQYLMRSLQTFPQHDDPHGDLYGSVHQPGSQHHCDGHSSGPAMSSLVQTSCVVFSHINSMAAMFHISHQHQLSSYKGDLFWFVCSLFLPPG